MKFDQAETFNFHCCHYSHRELHRSVLHANMNALRTTHELSDRLSHAVRFCNKLCLPLAVAWCSVD